MKKIWDYVLIGLSLFGVGLASYITYFKYHLDMQKLGQYSCDISKKLSCSTVYTSKYNEIFGVPVSVYGIVFYIVLFFGFLSLYVFNVSKYDIKKYIKYWLIFGLLFSAYLTFYVELLLIKSYCIYCLISALNILLMFIIYIERER